MEDFRQFRKGVQESKEYLLVGIDVAEEKHHAFFGAAAGRRFIGTWCLIITWEGFRRLLVKAEAVKIQAGLARVVFGMEPTGNYPKPLGAFDSGWARVMLVSGVAAHENRKTLAGRWDSNDGKDAANIADLISQENPCPAAVEQILGRKWPRTQGENRHAKGMGHCQPPRRNSGCLKSLRGLPSRS